MKIWTTVLFFATALGTLAVQASETAEECLQRFEDFLAPNLEAYPDNLGVGCNHFRKGAFRLSVVQDCGASGVQFSASLEVAEDAVTSKFDCHIYSSSPSVLCPVDADWEGRENFSSDSEFRTARRALSDLCRNYE